MVTYTSIISAVIGFFVTFASGYFVIPYLRKLNFGQTILEDGPKWHRSKQGTPTMGGIMIILGAVIALGIGVIFSLITKDRLSLEFAFREKVVRWVACFGLALGMGVIGFADDYIKVVKKRNLGLTARQKTFAQLIL
jgi:phospho-N-acetylmuramoyl-pentapeptide-transferase